MSLNTLQFDDISFRYRSSRGHALQSITAKFTSRAIAILGPNGAGKSTLFSILATTAQPEHGTFKVGSWSSNSSVDVDNLRRHLGVMPQDLRIFGGYSCAEFLRYVSWLRIADASTTETRISRALDLVSLSGQASDKVKTLSGGMRQRLGLAQALVCEPQLLLLDEPTVGLDPAQRHAFREHLLQVRENCTVVMATHLVDDVAAFADEVMVLVSGEAVFVGSLVHFCGQADGDTPTGADVERAYLAITGSNGLL